MIAPLALVLACVPLLDEGDDLRRSLLNLESDTVAEREAAASELVRQGQKAVKPLREARVKAASAELRARLDEVLGRIRDENPLTPEKARSILLDIDLKSPRVSDVAVEIERRTGYPVQCRLGTADDADLFDMKLTGVSLEALLTLATRPVGLDWMVENGEKVVITGVSNMPFVGGALRIIDVREMTGFIYDQAPVELGLLRPPPAGFATSMEAIPGLTRIDTLVELIRDGVAKGSWEDPSCSSVACYAGFLLVRAKPQVCDEVERFLSALRETALRELRVRASLVALKESAVASILDGNIVREEALRRALAEGKDAVHVGEQDLTAFDDARVAAFSGRETHFVAGYSADGAGERREIREGFAFWVRPTTALDRKRVKLNLEAALCKLEGLERLTTRHGEVQVPTISIVKMTATQTIPMDVPVAVASQSDFSLPGREPRRLVLIVRVTLKK